MYVEQIELENFRNYERLKLALNPKVNLILGKNGEGKTNLLESIFFAFSGEPLRFANNSDLIRHSLPFARVELVVQHRLNRHTITAQVVGQKRKITVDSKSVSIKALHQHFQSVVFTPESLAVIKEGPAQRRQLLDEIWVTVSPEAIDVLAEYKKCLASRNQLLKGAFDGHLSAADQRHLIESLNESFLPLATEVSWGRIQAAKQCLPAVREAYSTLLDRDSVEILVEYVISHHGTIDWSKNQVYDLLASRLKELQAIEIQAGMSLVGPHKHDVRFLVEGKDARVFCSQGQQRAIALAFKVAQVRLHKARYRDEPILLLDDVFSELDSIRREKLLAILSELQGQIILTAIDDSAPALQFGSEVSVFHVNKGQVT